MSRVSLPNLPNSLTILRIFFVPLMVVVLLTKQPNWPVHFEAWGVMILLLAAATDLADGYFARKRREVTTLGILLDPIADKLLIAATFIPLVQMGLMPAWMAVVIIGREFIVQGLREIASVEGLLIPAGALGMTANHPALRLLGVVLLWLVVITAVASACHYFIAFWGQIRFRVDERRRKTVVLVDRKEKPQDVLTR
jgi:CDP-diacylglycerol--glycerol-3-phosphate 3-phosphatidyltransferase